MSKFNQLKKSLVNHPTDNFENNSQTDYEFSNYSLEELRAKGDELWERSRQQDPDYYHRLNQWLESKSLDELVKLYGELITSDFEVTASTQMERDSC